MYLRNYRGFVKQVLNRNVVTHYDVNAFVR